MLLVRRDRKVWLEQMVLTEQRGRQVHRVLLVCKDQLERKVLRDRRDHKVWPELMVQQDLRVHKV